MTRLKQGAACLLALIFAGTASAATSLDILPKTATTTKTTTATKNVLAGYTYIRITGAQGLRGAVHQGIGHILQAGYSVGYIGTSLLTANQAVFTGTTATGGYPVVIKTSFGTSVGGIRSIVENLNLTWLADTDVGPSQTLLESGSATGATSPANVTVSGEFQATTRYPSSPSLVDQVMGVFPYTWVRNAGSPASLWNINSTLAQALFTDGQAPLSQFTGLNSDEGTNVTLVGRDEGASSREEIFKESGFGIYNPPIQYQLTVSGTAGPTGTVVSGSAYPGATVDGVSYPIGQSGYTTFSSEVAVLNTPGSSTAPILGQGLHAGNVGGVVCYTDIVDAVSVNSGTVATGSATISSGTLSSITVTNGGTDYNSGAYVFISGGGGAGATAVATVSVTGVITGITITNGGSGYTSVPTVAIGGNLIAWNGVYYSPEAVQEGQYTYWSYAHMMYPQSYTGTGMTVSNQLEQQILNSDMAVSGSLISNMNVGRDGDGTFVYFGNPY